MRGQKRYSRRYLKFPLFIAVFGPATFGYTLAREAAGYAGATQSSLPPIQLGLVILFLVKPRRWSLLALIVSTCLHVVCMFVVALRVSDLVTFFVWFLFIGVGLAGFIDEFSMPIGSERYTRRESETASKRLFKRAHFLQRGGRYEDALRIYRELTNSFPSSKYAAKARDAICDITEALAEGE